MAENINGLHHDRKALILYGSETGNSQDVAEELGRLAERLHFMTRVDEMDAVELSHLSQYTVVVFSISTTGQGEFPKNARKFWKSLLRKRLPPDCLKHVNFTTFGLGDSSYPKFNFTSRKLHKRLEQLGGKQICSRGEADDQHSDGIDGTFLSWSVDFRKHLLTAFPLPEGVDPLPFDAYLCPKYILEFLPKISNGETSLFSTTIGQYQNRANIVEEPISLDRPCPPTYPPASEQLRECYEEPHSVDVFTPPNHFLNLKDSFNVDVFHNKCLTPDYHWQDVREIEFLVDEQYELFPGDYVTVHAKNFPEDVDALITLQGWEKVADIPLKFVATSSDFSLDERSLTLPAGLNLIPLEGSTLRELLTHNLDICAIPKRHFFHEIAQHTTDPAHQKRLLEFGDTLYIDEYYDYVTRPRRSILEVLQDFSSIQLPWKWAVSIFPVIRGRHYSISSGGALKGNAINGKRKIQILVAIVEYRTILKKVRHGLCSRYLASLQENTRIRIQVNSTNEFYKLARACPSVPILCIAPGTGLAPIRSMIWERAMLPKKDVAPTYLFYGGRNRSADFFYESDWKRHELQVHCYTAFSRDQKEKIYVQDVLKKEKNLVADLILKQHAIIFVCGSSGNMPTAVRQTILDILREEFVGSKDALEEWFAQLDKQGRYVQETW